MKVKSKKHTTCLPTFWMVFLKFFGHVTSQHPQASPKEASFKGWGLKNFIHPSHYRLELGELLDLSMNSALSLVQTVGRLAGTACAQAVRALAR